MKLHKLHKEAISSTKLDFIFLLCFLKISCVYMVGVDYMSGKSQVWERLEHTTLVMPFRAKREGVMAH